jgi:hypothetical protein
MVTPQNNIVYEGAILVFDSHVESKSYSVLISVIKLHFYVSVYFKEKVQRFNFPPSNCMIVFIIGPKKSK